MSTFKWTVLVAALVVGNVVTAFLALTRGEASRETLTVDDVLESPRGRELVESISRLEAAIENLSVGRVVERQGSGESREAPAGDAPVAGSHTDLVARVDGLETMLTDFQKKKFPELQERNYWTLATMEKNAERYGDAIEHVGASIERNSDKQTRLWRMMYRAWYIQLRDGDAAGIDAYREVEQTRQALGVNIEKMKTRLADKIREAEERPRAPGE